jgi:hypothetical protein
VVLEERPGLWLPASAVRLDRALPYVLALEGGKVSARTVRTGLRSRDSANGGERLEIVEGLAEGAQVLAGSIVTVAEGTAWKPAATTPATSATPATPLPGPGASAAGPAAARPASR